jgi:hypothetical protein
MPAGRPTKYKPKSGIYALLCPKTKQIRYIGQSIDIQRRYQSHCSNASRNVNTINRYYNWIRSINDKPILKILEYTKNLDEKEVFYIEKYSKTCDLVNFEKGGKRSIKGYERLSINLKNMFRDSKKMQTLLEELKIKYLKMTDSEKMMVDFKSKILMSK